MQSCSVEDWRFAKRMSYRMTFSCWHMLKCCCCGNINGSTAPANQEEASGGHFRARGWSSGKYRDILSHFLCLLRDWSGLEAGEL